MEFRALTIQEKTSVISACGGATRCSIYECEQPALFLATIDKRRLRLCAEHLQEFQDRESGELGVEETTT